MIGDPARRAGRRERSEEDAKVRVQRLTVLIVVGIALVAVAVAGILTYHYLRRRDVYLLTRVESLEFPTPGSASLSVLAALAGTPIESPDSIRSLRADVYRFDLGLEDEGDGEWRVVSAAWRPAQLDDFM